MARRSGLEPQSAEDAVQGFWLQLLERDTVAGLSPERGRLRGFLRTTFRNYLAAQHAHDHAKKRGGNAAFVSLDFEVAESGLSHAPLSPDEAYEREWGIALMEQALRQLRQEHESGERRGRFELVLDVFGFGADRPYREVAATHQMTVSQVKAFAHRCRSRFRCIVEELVAETVPSEGEVVSETQEIWRALKR